MKAREREREREREGEREREREGERERERERGRGREGGSPSLSSCILSHLSEVASSHIVRAACTPEAHPVRDHPAAPSPLRKHTRIS